MSVLSEITDVPINQFRIEIGEIDSWMEVTLRSDNKSFEYLVSYICDPLNDLLEAVVCLLHGKKYYRVPNYLINNAIIDHDLEGKRIVWLFSLTEDKMRVLIWDNFDFDIVEDLYFYKFDKEAYEYNMMEDLPDVTKDLIFAFEGSPKYFAQELIAMFDKIDERFKGTDEEGEWGISYSKSNYQKLSSWLEENKHN